MINTRQNTQLKRSLYTRARRRRYLIAKRNGTYDSRVAVRTVRAPRPMTMEYKKAPAATGPGFFRRMTRRLGFA